MKPNALYVCISCEHYFESEYNNKVKRYYHPNNCPNCNSLYFTWINYSELFENDK